MGGQAAASGEIIGILDDVSLTHVQSSRALLDGGLPAGLNGVKLIACDAGSYATARLLRRSFAGRGETFGEALAVLRPSPELLKKIRADFPSLKLIVAPYDVTALRAVERAPSDALQIDPPCMTNLELVRAAAELGKPVMLSTWGCTREELDRAMGACGSAAVMLVHILRDEPAESLLDDVAAFRGLIAHGHPVGAVADPAKPLACGLAVAMGARLLQVRLPGLARGEASARESWSGFVEGLRRIERVQAGLQDRSCSPDELDELEDLRVGLTAATFIAKGSRFEKGMIAVKAPAAGLGVDLLPHVLNRAAAYDIEAGEPITFGMLQ